MTANPEDYGDPKPSDLDDVPPQNRGDLLEEHAYRIRKQLSKIIKPKQPALVNPDTQQQVEKVDVRTSWMALLLERIRPGEYRVLRQDGFRGIAYTHGDDTRYDSLQIGEYVSLEQGTIPGTYYITGDARHNELSTLVLYNTEIIGPTNTSKKITVDAVDLETGDSLVAFDGGFRVLQQQFALYEISYSFSVEQTDNYELDGMGSIAIGNNCEEVAQTYLESPRLFTGFRAVQNSGLKIRHSVDDRCNAYLVLDVPKDNYLPTTSLIGDTAWSDVGHIGNSFKVGMDVPRGWLHIGRAFSKVSLAAGNKELKMIFPNNNPVNGSHLAVEGTHADTYGMCVQTKWTRAGGTGVIQAYNCYSQCVQWIVENGLIISGPGIVGPTGNGVYVDCTETPESFYECNSTP